MNTKLNFFKYSQDFVEFSEGAIIFYEGQLPDAMYVVQEGEVEIILNNNVVETLQSGHIFGEMALINNHPRHATAIAKTDCKLVPIDSHRFKFMVDNSPNFAIKIMRVLTERLLDMDTRLMLST